MARRRNRSSPLTSSDERRDEPPSSAPSSMEMMFTAMTRMFERFEARDARMEERAERMEKAEHDKALAPRLPGKSLMEFQKLKPPVYTGSSDAEELDNWIEQMRKLFLAMECSEEEMMVLAPHQLEGSAHAWWRHEVDRLGDTAIPWERFQRMLREKFLPKALRRQLRDQFLHLKQRSMTVTEYEHEFIRLSKYAEALIASEEDKIDQFVQGLRQSIRTMVVAHPITSYADAVNSALMIEISEADKGQFFSSKKREREKEKSKFSEKQKFQKGKQGEKQKVKCFKCGRLGHYANECRSKDSSGSASRDDRVCFTCGQKGHISPNCPKKKEKRQQQQAEKEKPKVQAKVFSLTQAEAEKDPDVITGTN